MSAVALVLPTGTRAHQVAVMSNKAMFLPLQVMMG